MKYLLKRDLPLAPKWTIVNAYKWDMFYDITFDDPFSEQHVALMTEENINEWLEDIKDKKTFDDLEYWDDTYRIQSDWTTGCYLWYNWQCRSETFVTREEAEDEHKRRDWRVRRDKFIPKEGEVFFTAIIDLTIDFRTFDSKVPFYVFCVNSWLAFRTEEEAEKAFEEHDLKRLFYTII